MFVAERLVDLPGLALVLRLDSAARAPGAVANLATSLVIGLSLALAAVVALLVRDVRRRATAEQRLGEELALRQAMENSLVTGLRARDMAGRITYVNPAFCTMVGFSAEQLIGQTTPPYWPPEMHAAYEARHAQRLERGVPAHEQREGHETTFMRANGERFPVLIFEAPLVGAGGRQHVLPVARGRPHRAAGPSVQQLDGLLRLLRCGDRHGLSQPFQPRGVAINGLSVPAP